MNLEQRTILITGGTSGIGLEAARQLSERGNVVIVTGRDQGRLDRARRAVSGLHAIRSDAADPSAILSLRDEMTERFPALDVLINNAGIMRKIDLTQDRSLDDLTQEIEIGLSAPLRITQAFLSHLMTRPAAVIVNVTSGLAFVPFKIAPIYSAAKAGLHAYTRCLRAQLADTRLEVIEIAPPGTETPLFRGEFAEEMSGQKAMPTDVLVRHMIRGIEAGRSDIRPGLAKVLGLAGRLAPSVMFNQLAKVG